MIRAAVLGLAIAACALPAAAQDYYATTTTARHGNGYSPSGVVAGWEEEESFTVIAFAADGSRVTGASGAAIDWKATVVTGPRAEAEDDDEEDERYLDKAATNPPKRTRTGPPVPRTERVYASTACPAVMARMQALKPLTTFEFDPPAFKGNQDGAVGDGREGYDLWMRVGGAELSRSAETPDSALGRWFAETLRAFAACSSKSRATG